MPLYTITINTETEDWVVQERAESPEEAFALAIGKFPHEDCSPMSQEDEDCLVSIANKQTNVYLTPREQQKNVWSWEEGWRLSIPMYCHVIRTDEK